MPIPAGYYRVRRKGQSRFHIVDPGGNYVLSKNGVPSHYSTYKAAKIVCDKLNAGSEKQ